MKKPIRRSVITVLKQTTLVLFAFSLPPARTLSDAADRPAKGTDMQHFSVETDAVPLPRGATAKARRVKISRGGKLITALSQGSHRAYLYPVFTPAGAAVTTESPIDHPHHQSITIGADHFNVYYPYSTDKFEEANYNFYVNETFQGRSAGRIVGIGFEAEEMSEDHLRIVQNLEWRGAAEWGAPAQGRVLAHETRTIDIHTGKTANIIDIRSALRPGNGISASAQPGTPISPSASPTGCTKPMAARSLIRRIAAAPIGSTAAPPIGSTTQARGHTAAAPASPSSFTPPSATRHGTWSSGARSRSIPWLRRREG